jgi:hypothetical protein
MHDVRSALPTRSAVLVMSGLPSGSRLLGVSFQVGNTTKNRDSLWSGQDRRLTKHGSLTGIQTTGTKEAVHQILWDGPGDRDDNNE